jgi:hypothetical protein
MFSSSNTPAYLHNTLVSLKTLDPEYIVLNFEKINPNIWDASSYDDSQALAVLGKDNFSALMFGIRNSDKPAEKRLEMWERKQDAKGIKKMLSSAPSTKYFATPGQDDRALEERLRQLRTEGGRRKSKKTKGKSIRRRSIKGKKSIKGQKSIGGKKSIKRKTSIKRKIMQMY